jgi:transcriptional regulator with XRE-family HTH domain
MLGCGRSIGQIDAFTACRARFFETPSFPCFRPFGIGLSRISTFRPSAFRSRYKRSMELRESRGLTQARIVELLDVSPRVYNRWETTGTAPRLDTLVRIADILSVTLDELVGRSEPSDDVQTSNPKLRELYAEIDGLSDEDQKALIVLLDSLVKRSRMGRVLAS